MSDTLMTIIGIFLAVVLMFIFPLMEMAGKNDEIAQTVTQVAVSDFVNTVAAQGKITQFDYNELIQKLYATGNAYDIQIEAQILDDNPRRATTTATSDLQGEYKYYSVYTNTILDAVNGEKGIYQLKKDDYIIVSVKNANITMGTQLKNFLYKMIGKDTYTIGASASALVLNGKQNVTDPKTPIANITETPTPPNPPTPPENPSYTLRLNRKNSTVSEEAFNLIILPDVSSSMIVGGFYNSVYNAIKDMYKRVLTVAHQTNNNYGFACIPFATNATVSNEIVINKDTESDFDLKISDQPADCIVDLYCYADDTGQDDSGNTVATDFVIAASGPAQYYKPKQGFIRTKYPREHPYFQGRTIKINDLGEENTCFTPAFLVAEQYIKNKIQSDNDIKDNLTYIIFLGDRTPNSAIDKNDWWKPVLARLKGYVNGIFTICYVRNNLLDGIATSREYEYTAKDGTILEIFQKILNLVEGESHLTTESEISIDGALKNIDINKDITVAVKINNRECGTTIINIVNEGLIDKGIVSIAESVYYVKVKNLLDYLRNSGKISGLPIIANTDSVYIELTYYAN